MIKKLTPREVFGKRVQAFLDKYGIEALDLAKKVNANKTTIKEVIAGTSTFSFDKTVEIAGIFGLEHYDFSNPNFQIPDIEELPDETHRWIKKINIMPNRLSVELDNILNRGLLNKPATAKLLFLKMDKAVTTNKKSFELNQLLRSVERSKKYGVFCRMNDDIELVYLSKEKFKDYKSVSHQDIVKKIEEEVIKLEKKGK